MFKDSLLESTGTIRSSTGWTTILSFACQAALLLAVVLVARFSSQALSPSRIDISLPAPALTSTPEITRPVKVPRADSSADTAELSTAAPSASTKSVTPIDSPAPFTNFAAFTTMIGTGVTKPAIVELAPAAVATKSSPSTSRIRVSSGSIRANCISCPPPLYPAAAKAMRVSGTVVLAALISADGTVENLQVVSGPPLLRNSAIEAARTWRYKPTTLSGRPVEVEAEIDVVFHLD